MGKCKYCSKEIDKVYGDREFCSSACQEKYTGFMEIVDRRKGLFLGGIIFSCLLSIAGIIAKSVWAPGIIITYFSSILVGLTFFLCPFCTPETVSAVGVKHSVFLLRVISVAMMLCGVVLIVKYFVA
ncbi:MAG: hypothetical protein Q4C55_00940 [Eubacterium sp.]|nr:hypothetical protein [Eubacterium sp.]